MSQSFRKPASAECRPHFCKTSQRDGVVEPATPSLADLQLTEVVWQHCEPPIRGTQTMCRVGMPGETCDPLKAKPTEQRSALVFCPAQVWRRETSLVLSQWIMNVNSYLGTRIA